MRFAKLADAVIKRCRNTFREDVKYLPKTGGVFDITGVWDDATEMVDPNTEQVVSSNLFSLGFRFADLPEKPVKGDKLEVLGKEYKVIEIKEDGVEDISGILIVHKVG